MYEPLRRRALALLKVPAEPHPPLGDPASLRVFRAGRNYYRLRMATWAITQLFALAAIVFWTGMLVEIEHVARAQHQAGTAATSPTAADQIVIKPASAERNSGLESQRERVTATGRPGPKSAGEKRSAGRRRGSGWAGFKQMFVEAARLMPTWVFPIVWLLKGFGFLTYLIQIPLTYAVRRLDYEMRWYLVTDRSLRLRHGVWIVWESTMSFANVQQVVISQGPLQRLLGLANVKVQSAGGGTSQHEGGNEDMHVGYFHSVTNAGEIRDLILERLRQFRESGLGDPDEKVATDAAHAGAAASDSGANVLAAARELVSEARALRAAIT